MSVLSLVNGNLLLQLSWHLLFPLVFNTLQQKLFIIWALIEIQRILLGIYRAVVRLFHLFLLSLQGHELAHRIIAGEGLFVPCIYVLVFKIDSFVKVFGEVESFDSLLCSLFIFRDRASFSFFLSDIALFLFIGAVAFGFFCSPPATFLLYYFFLLVAQTCVLILTMNEPLEVVADVRQLDLHGWKECLAIIAIHSLKRRVPLWLLRSYELVLLQGVTLAGERNGIGWVWSRLFHFAIIII